MHDGNRLKAAEELGISRCYLHRLLNQFNLAEEEAAQQELEERTRAQQKRGRAPFGSSRRSNALATLPITRFFQIRPIVPSWLNLRQRGSRRPHPKRNRLRTRHFACSWLMRECSSHRVSPRSHAQ